MVMPKKIGFNIFIGVFLSILPVWGFSAEQVVSIGSVADNALVPAKIVSEMISAGCLILGVALLAGSFIRYTEYRRNPVQTRLSTPVLFFIFGLTLVLLPYIGSFSEATVAVDNEQKHVESPSLTLTPAQEAQYEQEAEKQLRAREEGSKKDVSKSKPQ